MSWKPTFLSLSLIFLVACGSSTKVRLEKMDRSPVTNGVRLILKTPKDSLLLADIPIRFEVEGFELGAQTDHPNAQRIANSAKGQHIHLIIDNAPYMAHYAPEFKSQLNGKEKVMLAFLSRSFHESVKVPEAFVFEVLTDANRQALQNGKHLFHSRPKGTYKAGQPILLDFYLINTDLKDGTHILASIDGNEFIIRDWQPHWIHGLEPGEHTVSLTLINPEGEPIKGPFSQSNNRTFTIKQKP